MPTLSNPIDCSPPGSTVHGIFQAKVLEWVAIAFSIYYANTNQKKAILVILISDKVDFRARTLPGIKKVT